MRKNNSIKLIAFDLDGVLIDGRGSWTEVHKGLGTLHLSEERAKKFREGKITFDEWARLDAETWKGIEVEKIKEILYQVKLMKGSAFTLKKLKEKGYKIAVISGGLKILADHLKEKFNLDYTRANELLVKEGKIEGMKHIIDMEGKGAALKEIAEEEGLKDEECAAVGDYINDIPMFEFCGFSIAFNPKVPEVEKAADVTIYEKDLRKILEFF